MRAALFALSVALSGCGAPPARSNPECAAPAASVLHALGAEDCGVINPYVPADLSPDGAAAQCANRNLAARTLFVLRVLGGSPDPVDCGGDLCPIHVVVRGFFSGEMRDGRYVVSHGYDTVVGASWVLNGNECVATEASPVALVLAPYCGALNAFLSCEQNCPGVSDGGGIYLPGADAGFPALPQWSRLCPMQ